MKTVYTFIKKLSITGRISGLIIVLTIFIAVFAGSLSGHPHNLPSGEAFERPGVEHLLGTDDMGIDIWAQISYGARISIIVGLFTALFAGFGGSLLGIVSAYIGGNTDRVVMRITDFMIVLPDLPMMIVLAAFFGPSLLNIIIVLSLFSWTVPARIVRSKVLSMKQESFVSASKSFGAGFFHLSFKHFIPGVLPLIAVSIIRLSSMAIVAEAGLSFLGLGDPSSKSWGIILNHAINFDGIYFTDFWKWWIMSPLIAITILITAIAFLSRDIEKIYNAKI